MPQLTPEQPQQRGTLFGDNPTGRRNFLKASFFAMLAAAEASCAPPQPTIPTLTPEVVPNELPNPYLPLTHEINALPESYLKGLLKEIVLGKYFAHPTPTSVDFEHFSVPLTTPVFEQTTFPFDPKEDLLVHGWLNYRRESLDSQPPAYKPVTDTTVPYPVHHLLTPEELAGVDESIYVAPGVPAVQVTFDSDITLFSHLAPEILVSSADPQTIGPENIDHLNSIIHYVTVKEAAGLLLVHIHLEEMVQILRELKVRTDMPVTDSSGKPYGDIEYITQLFSAASLQCGRSVAALDVAANFVAIHAVDDTTRQHLKRDPTFNVVVDTALAIPPGTSSNELLKAAYAWSLQPASQQLPHNCSFNNIP